MTRSIARVLVDQLVLHGVDTAFCVPGESYIAVLDALRDAPIRLISTRHEAAAANMAEAYGKLTGKPGICLVTRGPGATHASVGLHTAFQDSTPLILLVGQVPRRMLGREAFQELDYTRAFTGLVKWAAQPERGERVPELVARAFSLAASGRPGPVVLALPEDLLVEDVDVPDATRYRVAAPAPASRDLEVLRALLAASERPLAIVGEGGWSADAARDILAFCEANELAVATSFRCQDYVDNRSRVYAGHLTIGKDRNLARRVREADLILAVGGRLGEIATSGYTLLDVPRPRQTLVHVHPSPDELGVVYETDLPIVSALPQFAAAVSRLEPIVSPSWSDWTAAAHADYLENLVHRPLPGDVDMGEVMAILREHLPEDAIFTCGAGNFTVWAHRFYEFSRYGTQLAPRSGAMGYGLPAALAAKVVHPDRDVVCLAGDGDFLMTGQELATAVQFELPIVVLVVNNGMYGTIRMHQERHFPGRVVGTDLLNPDFVGYAESFGAHGARVERTEDFPEALEQALRAGRPALVELVVDREAITPRATLTEIREGVA
ncbi:MAG: thiamine pyrophosphate-binding protein [Actinomycetota bacterium]|nr:thiamine pyrophosphate-binding protein [Actinomycetota bacterium]